MSLSEIIDCGGKYEVHPKFNGGWAVVNSETGEVNSEYSDEREAVKVATELNDEAELAADKE